MARARSWSLHSFALSRHKPKFTEHTHVTSLSQKPIKGVSCERSVLISTLSPSVGRTRGKTTADALLDPITWSRTVLCARSALWPSRTKQRRVRPVYEIGPTCQLASGAPPLISSDATCVQTHVRGARSERKRLSKSFSTKDCLIMP